MAFALALGPCFAVRDAVLGEELTQVDLEVGGRAFRVWTEKVPEIRDAVLARHAAAVAES